MPDTSFEVDDKPKPGASSPSPAAAAPPPSGSQFVLWAYTATTFLSALLLFSVQPMFAKMVLPVLGGSPSVWAVAIFFFQAALLAGYCYAHLLIARVPAANTGFVHLGVCAVAFVLAMPIGLPASWSEPPPGEPYLWQLGLFTDGDRPALRGGLGQRAAAAGVVRPHRPSARPRSLLPLRGEQPRQPGGAAGLSVRAGAGLRAQGAEPAVGGAVRGADRRAGTRLLADAPGAGRAGREPKAARRPRA